MVSFLPVWLFGLVIGRLRISANLRPKNSDVAICVLESSRPKAGIHSLETCGSCKRMPQN
jgi:hypothetical protein